MSAPPRARARSSASSSALLALTHLVTGSRFTHRTESAFAGPGGGVQAGSARGVRGMQATSPLLPRRTPGLGVGGGINAARRVGVSRPRVALPSRSGQPSCKGQEGSFRRRRRNSATTPAGGNTGRPWWLARPTLHRQIASFPRWLFLGGGWKWVSKREPAPASRDGRFSPGGSARIVVCWTASW